MAREKGLEPLAQAIFLQNNDRLEALAKPFINEEVPSLEDALQGARDIMAEWINEEPNARNLVRRAFQREAIISQSWQRARKRKVPNTAIILNTRNHWPNAPRTACWPSEEARKRVFCGC